MLKKLLVSVCAAAAAVMLAVQPVRAAELSPFLEFYLDYIGGFGYADTLWLIQNSEGEFNETDIYWLIDNDCLDTAGVQWCVEHGLVPEEALQRPALQEPKTKPQTVFDGGGSLQPDGEEQKDPGWRPPNAEESSEAEESSGAEEKEKGGTDEEDAGTDESSQEESSDGWTGGSAGGSTSRSTGGYSTGGSGNVPSGSGATEDGRTLGSYSEGTAASAPSSGSTVSQTARNGYSETSAESEENVKTVMHSHYHENLDQAAKEDYAYFLQNGERCYIQVLSSAPSKTIEGKYLNGHPGEIMFGTSDGTVLYSFIFRGSYQDSDVLDLTASLQKEDVDDPYIERYALSLGSTYPDGTWVRVLVDRRNQAYTLYRADGSKAGEYTSDHEGFLELPVTEKECTVECDVFIGTSRGTEETESVPETAQEQETEVTGEVSTERNLAVPAAIAAAVAAGAAAAAVVLIRRKRKWF